MGSHNAGRGDASPPDGADRGVQLQREQAVRRLVAACADGRLTLGELTSRAEAAHQAATYAELSELVRDLPRPGQSPVGALRSQARRVLVGCLGMSGRWPHPALRPKVLAVACFGEVVINLVQTPVTSFQTEIAAVAILGEVTVVVPDGMLVETDQNVTVIGRVTNPARASSPGLLVPVIRVSATAILGSVRIENAGRRT